VLEITRFCIEPKYQIKNMASWFLSRIIKLIDSQYKIVVSFADTTVGHQGTIYKASNWKFDGIVEPDYYYSNGIEFFHKKSIWNQAKKLGITESELVIQAKLVKESCAEKHRYIKYL
jgi:hypothetical protein